jgi:hypothetical protein
MVGRASGVALALALGACALNPTPVSYPSFPSGVHHGINDAFHSALPADVTAHYRSYGDAIDFTIRTPQLGDQPLYAFMLSAGGFHWHILALIEAPDVVLAGKFAYDWTQWSIPILSAIENGNELELDPHNLTPAQYAEAQTAMLASERAAGFQGDVIMGSVYDITPETQQAIELAYAQCAGCLVGVHLYHPLSASDAAWLNSFSNGVAITEYGSPTGCGTAEYQAQSDYAANLRASFAQLKYLKYLLLYQRPSGPTCSNADTFGTQAFDGTWKPLDTLLMQWVNGH